MKKVVLVSFITILLLSFKEPENLKWYSLKEGLELARQDNKPMLIFLYASWCDMSQRMEKKVFNNKEVRPLLAEHFVLIKLNAEADTIYFKNDKILSRKVFLSEVSSGRLQIAVPTTILFREKENDRIVIPGVQNPADFLSNINKFLQK